MMRRSTDNSTAFRDYQVTNSRRPLFLCGDARDVLRVLPGRAVDCCVTSPPYWGQRSYHGGGIGLEARYQDYVAHLGRICMELRRVLKDTGSFWLNLGDVYQAKSLIGLPWRVAFELTDRQGWVLRNSVVWNKIKGGLDNTRDKLRNVHEVVFHFTQHSTGYYYNVDAIRSRPRQSRVVKGAVISATGVSGVRYRRQIELSTALTDPEKQNAGAALDAMLLDVQEGRLADFRMIIRGQQRATHSDSEAVSGRARELREKGFYFLKYHPNGSKPSDVWDILPEDTQKREGHFAPYPEDLCKIPILATCPEGGMVIDPFCGTGTTNLVAFTLGRKSVGIDVSKDYVARAEQRCHASSGLRIQTAGRTPGTITTGFPGLNL